MQFAVDENNQETWEFAAYFLAGFSLLYLLLLIWMRKKIAVAIGIFKEASRCIQSMPEVALYPFLTLALVLSHAAYFFAVFCYIYTCADLDGLSFDDVADATGAGAAAAATGRRLGAVPGELAGLHFAAARHLDPAWTPSEAQLRAGAEAAAAAVDGFSGRRLLNFNLTDDYAGEEAAIVPPMGTKNIMLLYHFFGFLWTNQFIQGMGMMIIAGAVAEWYWTPTKKGKKKGRLNELGASMKRTVCSHMGTVIFGSFIIALVQLIRAIMMYIDRKTKKLREKNKAMQMLFKIIHCCLWCLEKCLKFLSRNAYIMTAMKGTGFCKSCKDAIMLMIANMGRVAVVNLISALLLFLGKLAIAVGTGVVAYLWLENDLAYKAGGDKALHSTAPVMVVTVLLGYMIATSFMYVYDLAIDTILLCFCEDVRDGKPYFMPKTLKKFFKGAESKKSKKDRRKKATEGGGGAQVKGPEAPK